MIGIMATFKIVDNAIQIIEKLHNKIQDIYY